MAYFFATDTMTSKSTMHSPSYYAKCMFGGVLACGLTHASVVSLDVAKCRAQVSLYFSRFEEIDFVVINLFSLINKGSL